MSKEFGEPIMNILDLFYKLKHQYTDTFRTKYVLPIIQSRASKNEKRKKYIQLPKPKCVNCKRNVGTLFKITQTKEYSEKSYLAKCGDEKEPCRLLLQFTIPNVVDITKEFNSQNELTLPHGINDIIKQITNLKNDGMFGFIVNKQEFKTKFDELNNELQQMTKTYEIYLGMFIERTMPPEKEQELFAAKAEFEMSKQQFAENIKEFNKTQDTTILTNAIEFYVKSLKPLSEKISKLSYLNRYVELEDKIYYLKLQHYRIVDLEISYGKSTIEENKTGMVAPIKTLKRRPKATATDATNVTSKRVPKIKTLKNQPVISMQEEIAQEQEQSSETNQPANSSIKLPLIESSNSNSNSNSNSGFHNSNSPITAPSGEIDWGEATPPSNSNPGIEFTDLTNQPAILSSAPVPVPTTTSST